MSQPRTRRRGVFFFIGLPLAFVGLTGAGYLTLMAESGFHGLSFDNTRPALFFLVWGGLTGLALCLRSRIARWSLAVWAISLLAWILVLMVQSSDPASGTEVADDGHAAPPAIAAPDAGEPQTSMALPELADNEPGPLEAPPSDAPAEVEADCMVNVRATLAATPPTRSSPVATSLEFGISASRNEQGDALLEFETQPDGTAQFDVPWSDLAPGPDGKRPWLWVRSSGSGLLTRVAQQQAPEKPGNPVLLTLTVQPGTHVSGRLVGPDGEPVAGRVNWWSFGPDGVISSSLGQVGADGLFTGELHVEGTTGLWASGSSGTGDERLMFFGNESMDLGTGFSELFEVAFDAPVPFIEIRVSGPGVLRGRVVGDDGAPAAGLSLLALVAELDDEQGSFRPPYERTREIEQEGRGHYWVTTMTDGDGGFEFRGLRNDLYNVRTRLDGKSFGGYPTLLTPRPVPSHGDPLELVLTRPHLAIHVREADGSIPEEELVVHSADRWGGTLDEWPEQPGILVALGARHAHLNGWRGPYFQAQSVGPGEFIVELADKMLSDSALEVDVGVLGGDVPWQRVGLAIPPGSGRVGVDLVLPEPAPKAALVLDVVDAQGSAVVEQVRIRIVDPDSGVVLVDTSHDYHREGDWPMRFEMPEGEYRLLVEGHPWIDTHHGTIMERRVHGAHEQTLQVSAGSESRVTAALGEAARLSVRLAGSASEADRQAIRDRQGGTADDEYVAYWAPHVSMRLEREGHWPELPQFARYWMEGTSAAGIHLFSSVELGHEETSEPLSPGDYTLVASTPGGRELRRAITLVPGETLSVTLTFD